jgi:radical SAM superfamily enzyme YgiQ (UPF0313 family)
MVASLREAGYTADIIYPSEEGRLRTRADLARAIAEIQPLVLGFTSYEGSVKEALQFIREIKPRALPPLVCMGGHLATFSYAEILLKARELVDVIVLGEGEQAIIDIVEAVKSGRDFRGISGLAWLDGDRVVTTARRPIETDIDRLPYPMIPEADNGTAPDVPLFLTTSRGCYGHCSFCRSSHFGERWRGRDPVKVVDEIETAYAHGINTFEMVDDNFLGPGRAGKRRATAIAKEILRRRLPIQFHASCRVNDVDEPTMRILQEAGLISVSLGVESGVQRLLDTFNKNTTVEQNIAALKLLDRLSIRTLAYIIFFDPYTTLVEARENLDFLLSIRTLPNVRFELILFRKLIPVSGTELFEHIRGDGLLRGDAISGHWFVFRNPKVALLADFLESIDLRFEAALQNERFRGIDGMYALKESFQFLLAEKAIDLLASARAQRPELLSCLNKMFRSKLREAFGFGLGEPIVSLALPRKGENYHGKAQSKIGI